MFALGFLAAAAGVLTLGTHAAARTAPNPAQVTITQFRDLLRGHFANCLASGPDQSLWVTDSTDQDFGVSKIVQVATSGRRLHAFGYPTSAYPSGYDIIEGPDGNLWYSDLLDGYIDVMTPTGKFTSYGGEPINLTNGSDGAIWFTSGTTVQPIGRITTSGTITKFNTGISQDAGVFGITAGPDGALWFTEQRSRPNRPRITTTGSVTEFSMGISPNSAPTTIAAGPDGALWFTEAAGRIGRITTAGVVTEYRRGIRRGKMPNGIAAGPDGAMWFTEDHEAGIGRITLQGTITEYASGLSRNAGPACIVAGPDGNMWFVEANINRIGRVTL